MKAAAPNKFLQTDQIALSCLLQKAQKSRQYVLAAEERRSGCRKTSESNLRSGLINI